MSRGRCKLVGPAVLALTLLWPIAGRADALVADLTGHLVAITTGFTGASVVLFGATDGPGDVVVAVRGPERDFTVRRKDKVAGMWVNTEAVTFLRVPGYYHIAASRPLDEIVSPAEAVAHRLGVENLALAAKKTSDPEAVGGFAAALVRTQKRLGLFPAAVGKVLFLSDRLFRTTISLPADVPTGTYLVEVFLFRAEAIVSEQTTPLVVSKAGLDAAVFDFARRQSALYGAIAVLIAIVAGWIASLPFRGA